MLSTPALALAVLLASLAAGAAKADADGDLPWRRLRMVASKALVLRGAVEVTARRLPAEAAGLDECAEASGRPVGPGGAVLLEGKADSSVTKPSLIRAVLDASSTGVLQADDIRPGSRLKRRRFLDASSHVWRRKPEDRGARRDDPLTWAVSRHEHETWPSAELPPLPVTEGHALLYQVAAARLDREGATLAVLLWTHGRLVRLDLKGVEAEDARVSFVRRDAEGAHRVSGGVPARRVVVAVSALSEEGLPEDLDVLGMRGGIELLVEIGTGLPLVVRGDVKPVGRVAVRLVEADVGPAPVVGTK